MSFLWLRKMRVRKVVCVVDSFVNGACRKKDVPYTFDRQLSRLRSKVKMKGSRLRIEARGGLQHLKQFLSGMVSLITVLGLSFWVFSVVSTVDNSLSTGSLWAIAPAVAIFGVFGWAGGTGNSFCRHLRSLLRHIGILFTLAALFLTGMASLEPLIKIADSGSPGDWIFSVSYVLLGISSIAAVGFGTWKLVFNIDRLWQFREESPTCSSGCFGAQASV